MLCNSQELLQNARTNENPQHFDRCAILDLLSCSEERGKLQIRLAVPPKGVGIWALSIPKDASL
jgi:hypothetical protein